MVKLKDGTELTWSDTDLVFLRQALYLRNLGLRLQEIADRMQMTRNGLVNKMTGLGVKFSVAMLVWRHTGLPVELPDEAQQSAA